MALMIEANMLEAKTKLSQLVEAAERGEQVFLKRNGVVVAQIVPAPKRQFPFGFLKDKIGETPDSLLFGMPEEEIDQLMKL
jgi:antitoxin (DNA-binding transcriptional repressor) of toxin-antitoxin stability system